MISLVYGIGALHGFLVAEGAVLNHVNLMVLYIIWPH